MDKLRDKRDRGWFWLDNAVIDEYLPKIGVTAFAVYACIVRHSDPHGDAFPSYTKLQKELGCGRSQIAAAIKKIVDAGLVTITTGKRASNHYHIITVSTSPKPELVPIQNQSRNGTGTSSESRPELVPIRDSNNTQLTRPNEQDPREGERVRESANGHEVRSPPLQMGSLTRIPDPFEVTDELADWIHEHKMPKKWAINRLESFAENYSDGRLLLSLEDWYRKCRKWLLDDWNRDAKVAQGVRR